MKTHLVFAAMTIALLAFVISQSDRKTLGFDMVVAQAERLASEPHEPPQPIKSKVLRELGYDGLRDIRFKDDRRLWRDKSLPFQAAFLLAGGAHSSVPVTIYHVDRDVAGPIRFDADLFQIGEQVAIDRAELEGSGFTGFRAFYPINQPDRLDEFLVFPASNYFRFLAREQIWGLSARAVAVDTLGKEQFPAFTAFWLVQPPPGATEMTVYALLEGEALTGAYEFRIAPGPETKVRVKAVLFPRKTVKDIGIAPLTSMFWFGENTSNTFGDFRPEVHDSDGLQIRLSNDEWVWRPLAWAQQRQVNVFANTNPKGFGLFQRDRDFSHYQDLEANYHQRPSYWVEPDGDWGAGSVVLMQNPTDSEYTDNVVAYWRPDEGIIKGRSVEFAYSITAFTANAGLPAIASCVSTRIDYQEKSNFRMIVVDFQMAGERPAPDADVRPDVWIDGDAVLSDVQCMPIPDTDMWRVSFGVTAGKGNDPVEMRCALELDGRRISETWSYTWVK